MAREGLRRWVGAYCSAGAHDQCAATARCDCPCHAGETEVGVVLAPAKPKAPKQKRQTPKRRVVNPKAYEPRRLDRKFTNEQVTCPKCGAGPGEACVESDGRVTAVSHGARCSAARPKER